MRWVVRLIGAHGENHNRKKDSGVPNEHEPIMGLVSDTMIVSCQRLRKFLACHPVPLKTIGAGVGEAGG